MQSLQITKAGGPEVFKLIEKTSSPMVPDGIRIQVAASGVNFADLMMRMGMYPEAPPLPFVPGYELSGTVTEVGPLVKTVKQGDRVIGACKFGAYFEYVWADRNHNLVFQRRCRRRKFNCEYWFTIDQSADVYSG